MGKRITPSRGSKPDKIMREALSLELHREMSIEDPENKTKAGKARKIKIAKFRLVQRALVNAGIRGDVPAIKEINDRMDGKVAQTVQGTGKEGAIPIDIKSLTNEQLDQLLERIIAAQVLAGRP